MWWPKRVGEQRPPAKKVKQLTQSCRGGETCGPGGLRSGRLNMKHFRFHALGRGMHLDASTEKRGKRLFCSLQLPLRRGARGAGGPGGLVEGRDLVDGLEVK